MTKRIIFLQLQNSQPEAAGHTIIQSIVSAPMLETCGKFPRFPVLLCIPTGKQFFHFSLAPGHVLLELLPTLAFTSPETTN